MKKYDIIVIGAGSAGLGNAGVANTIGLNTLMIEEKEENFGGDCTNFGCVPSKALIHIAKMFAAAKKAEAYGLQIQGKADMKKVLSYIHKKQEKIKSEEDAAHHRAQGIDVEIGRARFINKKEIEVNGKKFTARKILLCTGSSPRYLSIPGIEKVTTYTNETLFFDCDKLPENFLVIGGGAIGCEMAQAFQRLGSKVTIVDRGERILAKERPEISKILQNCFEEEGIKIIYNSEVVFFEHGTATIKQENGEMSNQPVDAVLLAVGRVVNTKDMGLDKAGIELTEKGNIKVNEYLESTNKNVFVIGDAAGKYMFSHGAEKMVRQLWRNMLIPIAKKKNTTHNLSWVTFTDPEVATFGYTEKEMEEKNISYYRQDQSFAEDDRAIVDEYEYGRMSIWMDNRRSLGNRVIRSATMIAPKAGDLMQELQLSAEANIPIKNITQRVYPYPVASRINQKVIRGVMNKSYTDTKKALARFAFRLFH